MDIKDGHAHFNESEQRLLRGHNVPQPLPVDEMGVLALESVAQAERSRVDQFVAGHDELGHAEQVRLSDLRSAQQKREDLVRQFGRWLEVEQFSASDITPEDFAR